MTQSNEPRHGHDLPDPEAETGRQDRSGVTSPLFEFGDAVFGSGSDSVIPERINAYRITGTIGSGGMGLVYEAIHEQLGQKYAIKVLRYGIRRRSAVSRFEFEAKALAALRHEHIARFHEWGMFDHEGASVPYFVMEYVPEALPITEYAVRQQLDLRTRLGLFSLVCSAVHHGHVKGIIHRDLKPRNVLVDGNGTPRVIDFGLARATEAGPLLSNRARSESGALIGTPQYMAPEQCGSGDVDIRADVYSLGMILYELVSGRLPYDVHGVGIREAVRIICEDLPARLSSFDRRFRGDLETVAFKALAKERNDRYRSVAELGDDIRRFLGNEPIVARPPSLGYQARKFVMRHRALSGAVAVIVLLVFAATVLLGSLLIEARTKVEMELSITELREEKDSLGLEIGALTNDKSVLVGENALLDAEKAALTSDKAALTNDNASLTNDNAALTRDNAALVDEKAALTKESDALAVQLEESTDRLSSLMGLLAFQESVSYARALAARAERAAIVNVVSKLDQGDGPSPLIEDPIESAILHYSRASRYRKEGEFLRAEAEYVLAIESYARVGSASARLAIQDTERVLDEMRADWRKATEEQTSVLAARRQVRIQSRSLTLDVLGDADTAQAEDFRWLRGTGESAEQLRRKLDELGRELDRLWLTGHGVRAIELVYERFESTPGSSTAATRVLQDLLAYSIDLLQQGRDGGAEAVALAVANLAVANGREAHAINHQAQRTRMLICWRRVDLEGVETHVREMIDAGSRYPGATARVTRILDSAFLTTCLARQGRFEEARSRLHSIAYAPPAALVLATWWVPISLGRVSDPAEAHRAAAALLDLASHCFEEKQRAEEEEGEGDEKEQELLFLSRVFWIYLHLNGDADHAMSFADDDFAIDPDPRDAAVTTYVLARIADPLMEHCRNTGDDDTADRVRNIMTALRLDEGGP